MISRRKLLSGVAAVAAGTVIPKSSVESLYALASPANTGKMILGMDFGSDDRTGIAVLADGKIKTVMQILVDGVWQRLDGMKTMDLIDGADYDLRYDEVEIVLDT